MSEYIGMSIEIGGTLPISAIADFLDAINTDINDLIDIDNSIEGIKAEAKKNSSLTLSGISNYGECEDIKAICRKYKLSYLHNCEAKYEYNAEVKYWTPGMKTEQSLNATQSGEELIKPDTIRPIISLMLDHMKMGAKALPLYINEEDLISIIEPSLKNPKKFYKLLEKKLAKVLPTVPKIPNFIIEGVK